MQNERDIRECLRRGDVAGLFAKLGWAVDELALHGHVWRAWGWFGEVPSGRIICRAPGCRVVQVDGALQRRLVVEVARRAPLDQILWFFVDDLDITLAVAVPETDQRPVKVRTMVVERETPAPVAVLRLQQLDLAYFARDEVDPAVATRRHLEEVLDQETLTRDFFTKFSASLRTLAATMLHGPSGAEERWHAALTVLLRLIFLYILQRERLLNRDARYVARRLRSCIAAEVPFYEATLRPLFFGVLNTPPEQRDDAARNLGDVPFLNGGLFEPSPIELEYPNLTWPNAIVGDVIEQLFEHFHFTAAEPSRADEACVVDPEMLGKVFEGLMYGDSRKASGAFYTPRHIVSAMVERALDDHLADRRADGVDEATALAQVRILDPAVGTGAFLLEALAALRARRQALGMPDDYATVRRLVHAHLFGVDRNRTAVRLCELRLWLAMLATFRDVDGPIEPLPNLSHRIVTGDSLLDEVSALRKTAPITPALIDEARRRETELDAAHAELLDAHGTRKQAARRRVVRAERDLHDVTLRSRAERLLDQILPLRAAVESRDLFGECAATTAQRTRLVELEREHATVSLQREQLQRRDDLTTGFSYETRFGAAAREGFDIIVTNPPWVRAQRVDRDVRDAFAARYQSASGQLWAGAAELGIRAPYGAQPDLAALFVERSMELLRPGGRLAALVPAKLFRALHAAPMRRLLSEHRIEQIEDLSDADQQLFDATTYPGIIHVQKDRPANDTVYARVWRGAHAEDATCGVLATSPGTGAPWLLAPPDVQAILAELARGSDALGTRQLSEPQRGIFTGANDVFVRPIGEWRAELGDEVAPFVRPLLRGSGLGAAPTSEILWCYDGATPLRDLPKSLRDHFERHRDVLTPRSGHRADEPLWQMFRVRADDQHPRVVWRDMSVLLDPVVVEPGPVASNTVYYVAFDDRDDALGFARWMQSLPVRAVAYSVAERARGGWRRHFAWVVRMLPVPRSLDRWADFDESHFDLSDAASARLRDWLLGGGRVAA